MEGGRKRGARRKRIGRESRREKERTKGVENIEPDEDQPGNGNGNGHAGLENPPTSRGR